MSQHSTHEIAGVTSVTYADYRDRWLHVPGDHAPGKLLAPEDWQRLTAELAAIPADTDDLKRAARRKVLQRALLLG